MGLALGQALNLVKLISQTAGTDWGSYRIFLRGPLDACKLVVATFDWPAPEIVAFRSKIDNSIRGSGAHFDWPAHEIVTFRFQI